MEFDQIMKIIKAVSDSSLKSFEYDDGDTKLSLKKEKKTYISEQVSLKTAAPQLAEPASGQVAHSGVPDSIIDFEQVVKSPLVGTFYSSSSPEAEPFIKVGDQVKKGQTLGIIEAMKLMNEIESDCEGVVEAILIANEQVVEYGQPLFRIK